MPTILPRPSSCEPLPGTLTMGTDTVLRADDAARPAARLLAGYLGRALGTPPRIAAPGSRVDRETTVDLRIDRLDHAPGDPETYTLTVTPDGATLVGRGPTGLLAAVQAFRQLLPPQALGGPVARPAVAAVRITDAPRLGWRGLLLDVARHFTPVPDVLRLLDLMALHRLNVLHLHLTDDQGWRFEVAAYPLLTEIGGRRPEAAQRPEDPTCRNSGPAHEGWYTRADIATIVAFAAARGITVVPEINAPGHVQAALAAYPHLGNDPVGGPVDVWTRWGINRCVLNAEERTVRFFEDVLDEVMDAFPAGYVHLGGDECPVDEWAASARARERAAQLGLAGPERLHGWFTARLATHVARHGRRPVGWDELAEGDAPRETAITCWHGTATAESAARRGHDVILAPWQETYFDLHQAERGEPRGQRGVLTLRQSHAFDPFAGAFGEDLAPRLLGAQCQLWTEYIPGRDHLDYMLFPRLTAFADRAWGHSSDYPAFRARLTPHLTRLDALGVHYRHPDASDDPSALPQPVAPAGV